MTCSSATPRKRSHVDENYHTPARAPIIEKKRQPHPDGVRAITVYVKKKCSLGPSNMGAVFTNAVLDSGTALICTTTTIANVIYGSIGIAPVADGDV